MYSLDELRAAVRLADEKYDGVPELAKAIGIAEEDLAHVATQRGMRGVAHLLGVELNEESARSMMQDTTHLVALAGASWIDGFAAANLLKGSQA